MSTIPYPAATASIAGARPGGRMRRRLSLAGQFLAVQLVLVIVALVAAGTFWWQENRAQLHEQYAQRVLAIAESVATLPTVRQAFDDPHPERAIAPLAERIRRSTGASFVVVANERQIRYSHPVASRIGGRLSTDASIALSGQPWTGIQTGTTGRSMRAKVPVLDTSGKVIGVVSVGVPMADVADEMWDTLPYLGIAVLGLVALGAATSYLIFRRMRRKTYGLAAHEIGTLVEHRVAMLHAVREGVLAVDPSGTITLVNDEAHRLLDLPEDVEGDHLDRLDIPQRLHDVLTGTATGPDQIVLRRGRVLVLNRMPVHLQGREGGAVVTLRDRTQLDQLARELDGARTTTDALRAQAHEFSNRIYTIAGLLELGQYEQARTFVDELSATQAQAADQFTRHIRDPALAALLLAKSAAVRERGVEFVLAPETDLGALQNTSDRDNLILVVGNLIDNALESVSRGSGRTADAAGGTDGGWVRACVSTVEDGSAVWVEVSDSGPGVAPGMAEEVFRKGFTTKVAEHGGSRGLGLALVRQTCHRCGGWARVESGHHAVFTALLPVHTDQQGPPDRAGGPAAHAPPSRAGSTRTGAP